MKKDKILFLIRSYNEGKHLLDSIEIVKNEGFEKILVVDDGSTDKTEEILSSRNDIFYLRHVINRGAGAALETGFEFVRRYAEKINIDYVVTFDPDGQHRIKDIYKFMKEFEKNKDLEVAIGSRFIKGTAKNIPFHRKLILFLAKIFTFFISHVIVSDPHNGYRMFKVSAIKKIHLSLDGFEYSSELMDQIAVNKLKFTEVPVTVVYTPYSLSKGQKSLNSINIAFKMIWNKFFK